MERVAIIFGVDEDYIKEVLSILQLDSLKKKREVEFYALKWNEENFGKEILRVGKNFEVEKKSLKKPLKFQKSLILSLPSKKEISLHKKISSFLKKQKNHQLNPFSASFKADDKYFTISKLKKASIDVPASLLIVKRQEKEILCNLEKFLLNNGIEHFYIQPNFGTEGRETYFFSKKEFERKKENVLNVISTILPQPVIIKEKRGNTYFYDEIEKQYRQVVFRILVFQIHNKKVESEYGFLEISKDSKTFISSPEKGGKIAEIKDGIFHLYYKEKNNFNRLILTEKELSEIKLKSKIVFKTFNSGFKEKLEFCGMDFLLECKKGKVSPIVLEINPRPSGLNKLKKLTFLKDSVKFN